MALALNINGQDRVFDGLASPTTLLRLVAEMDLKADRLAVEHNGEIAPRARWPDIPVSSGDKLEVVHFVGGGMAVRCSADEEPRVERIAGLSEAERGGYCNLCIMNAMQITLFR